MDHADVFGKKKGSFKGDGERKSCKSGLLPNLSKHADELVVDKLEHKSMSTRNYTTQRDCAGLSPGLAPRTLEKPPVFLCSSTAHSKLGRKKANRAKEESGSEQPK